MHSIQPGSSKWPRFISFICWATSSGQGCESNLDPRSEQRRPDFSLFLEPPLVLGSSNLEEFPGPVPVPGMQAPAPRPPGGFGVTSLVFHPILLCIVVDHWEIFSGHPLSVTHTVPSKPTQGSCDCRAEKGRMLFLQILPTVSSSVTTSLGL